MVDESFLAWEDVWFDLGEQHYHQAGAIGIGVEPGDYTHRTLETFRKLGTQHQVIAGADLASLCSQYIYYPKARSVFLRNPADFCLPIESYRHCPVSSGNRA